jgi:putative FmdB family regulatory protein
VPIYDYVCSSCRHRIEVIHGINDAGPRFCPACGAEATMRKALVSPAIHFKGSGWAKKDRSSSSGTRARSGTDASSDGASSDAGAKGDGGAKGHGGTKGDGGAHGNGGSDGSGGSNRKPATDSGPTTPSAASEG